MVQGILTKEEFVTMKGNYSAEIERLKAAVSDLKAKLEDVMENRSERNRWISHFTQFATLQELDRRVVVQLIQSIRVMSKNELRITFNYADEYQKALALLTSAEQRKAG